MRLFCGQNILIVQNKIKRLSGSQHISSKHATEIKKEFKVLNQSDFAFHAFSLSSPLNEPALVSEVCLS